LFSPHFGAALQMLKLEIGGGGGFSSDGSEPSVEPAEGQLDYHGCSKIVLGFESRSVAGVAM